jgi:hypothetical protein
MPQDIFDMYSIVTEANRYYGFLCHLDFLYKA